MRGVRICCHEKPISRIDSAGSVAAGRSGCRGYAHRAEFCGASGQRTDATRVQGYLLDQVDYAQVDLAPGPTQRQFEAEPRVAAESGRRRTAAAVSCARGLPAPGDEIGRMVQHHRVCAGLPVWAVDVGVGAYVCGDARPGYIRQDRSHDSRVRCDARCGRQVLPGLSFSCVHLRQALDRADGRACICESSDGARCAGCGDGCGFAVFAAEGHSAQGSADAGWDRR